MARVSPLRKLHQQAEAAMSHYGDPAADVLVVETFGELELEYAALRKSCILLDQPYRAVLEITGADRIPFLNRMLTQELKDLTPFHTRASFWLNRKGRIDAAIRVVELGDRTLLDVDVHAAGRTLQGLSPFIIADDVAITDRTEATHRLALHGPTATPLLRAVSTPVAGPGLADLQPGSACTVAIAGKPVVAWRDDATGETGIELCMAAEDARTIYEQLVEAGQSHDGNGTGSDPADRFRLRPAGWHAFNIARIEAGRPLYNLDYGPTSLPHETGVLREHVSFTKGCYLGQEIVARMESRGKPKQTLVALRLNVPEVPGTPRSLETTPLPTTGSAVWPAGAQDQDPVGAVTSATLSPMLSAQPICFAMVKTEHAEPGTQLAVSADGALVPAAVQPALAFWRRS